MTERAREVIYRHTAVVRVWHWTTVLTATLLLMSGLYIFNMHPALYWGEDGHAGIPPLLSVTVAGLDTPHPTSTLQIGRYRWNTTGLLGRPFEHPDDPGQLTAWAVPPSLVFPWAGRLGDARAWHFLMAWMLVLSSLIYVAHGMVTGHFWRHFVPSAVQLRRRAIVDELRRHMTFAAARGAAARHYNLLQRTAYVVVVFILLPLEVVSGLTMSSGLGAVFPQLFGLFGGRQSARTVHFLTAVALVLFVVVHVIQVFAAGVRNEVGAMISGRFTVPSGEQRPSEEERT